MSRGGTGSFACGRKTAAATISVATNASRTPNQPKKPCHAVADLSCAADTALLIAAEHVPDDVTPSV